MLAAIASRLNLKLRQSTLLPKPSLAERISKRFARDQKVYPQSITMRKVFVLPRRHGFMVAFSTLGVFAIALRIQNNLLLLIALALFILFLMSLVWSGRNLAGLTLSLQPDQRLVAGVTQNLSITIKNNPQFDRPRHLLAVKKGKTSQPIDFSLGVVSVSIPVNIDKRGKMALPPILIESEFPFGLARCWSWVSAGDVLVAPTPKSGYASISHANKRHGQDHDDEEASGADSLADYIPGTAQTRIHWKRFAATGRLLVKTGDQTGGDRLIIDYASVRSFGHEQALQMMCAAVLEAEQQQVPFVMLLPNQEISSPTGRAGEALDALALA